MADKTQKIFDEIILKMAEVVKLINEDMEDTDTEMEKVDNLNDEISDLTVKIVDAENNFLSFRDLDKYCKDLLGKNYFADNRCWSYLHDAIYDVFYYMDNVIDDIEESMQTGLGMAQQLPTNSVYDGELDDLYNSDDEEEKKKMNKRLEEKKIDEEDRIEALAQFLGLNEEEKEEIEVDDETLTYDSEEYLVVTEDEGYEMAKEDVRYLLEDDLGLEGVTESTQEYAIENFCTYDWESDMHESHVGYAHDIDYESGSNGYATRLIEEAIDEKVIKEKDCFENEDGKLDYEDKDELAEMLADKIDKDYDSMGEWFESIYGRGWAKEMRDTLKDYIDWEALAEYVVDSDGVANTLARWDGQEHEEKVNGEWFYIYRTN